MTPLQIVLDDICRPGTWIEAAWIAGLISLGFAALHFVEFY